MSLQAIATIVIALVSTGSLILGIVNHIRQNRYAKVQYKLNKLRLDKEREQAASDSQAQVWAKFIRISKNDCRIRVSNIGKQRAYNVDFQLVEDPGWTPVKEGWPLEQLVPGQSVDVRVPRTLGSGPKAKYRVTWKDGTGSHQDTGILTATC